jgi:hypothetical protein
VIGLGSATAGAPTPIGDFYLTTWGSSAADRRPVQPATTLQLRSATRSRCSARWTMKDGARVLLQPYHMSNAVGIHNAFGDIDAGIHAADQLLAQPVLAVQPDRHLLRRLDAAGDEQRQCNVPADAKNLDLSERHPHRLRCSSVACRWATAACPPRPRRRSSPTRWATVYNLRLMAPTVTELRLQRHRQPAPPDRRHPDHLPNGERLLRPAELRELDGAAGALHQQQVRPGSATSIRATWASRTGPMPTS